MNNVKNSDTQFEEVTISKVEPEEDGWIITRSDGWAFFCPDHGIKPQVGDTARFYGRGIGSTVRGLAINGLTVFYRTEEEDRAEALAKIEESNAEDKQEYAEKAADFQHAIEKLPSVFQRRIERFRRTNPDFNWRYLDYELMCCEDAVAIAAELKTPEAINAFHDLPWEQQQKLVPELHEGHSGNSFGFACRLASIYLQDPMFIVQEHGGISPLVGCKDFGCEPGAGLEGEDLKFYKEHVNNGQS